MSPRARLLAAALSIGSLASTTAVALAPPAEAGQAGDGTRSIAVSASTGLDPAGQTVTVTGDGFDEQRGIYVAVCVVNPSGVAPGPCGGGQDREGSGGASAWISSNPPAYGEGLARPYGPGGSFEVSVRVAPEIAPGYDCRHLTCAVTTRNDHTRSGDRGQDLAVPVSFRADPPPPPPAPEPASPPEPVPAPDPVPEPDPTPDPAPAPESAEAEAPDPDEDVEPDPAPEPLAITVTPVEPVVTGDEESVSGPDRAHTDGLRPGVLALVGLAVVASLSTGTLLLARRRPSGESSAEAGA